MDVGRLDVGVPIVEFPLLQDSHRNVTSERVEVWGARGVRQIAELTKSSERGHWNHQK